MVIVVTRRCKRCQNDCLSGEIGVHGPPVCHACTARRQTAQIAAWRQAHPDRARAAQRRYLDAHPNANAEAHRRYFARLKADPVRWQQHLELRRIDYRLARERKGLPVRVPSPDAYHRRPASRSC